MKSKSLRYLWIALSFVWISGYVSAQSVPEISVKLEKPGTLGELIGNRLSVIEHLKISGDMNGTDVKAIRKMENLVSLDLKDANIKAGGDNYYEDMNFNYKTKDDVFPVEMFYEASCDKLASVVVPNSVTEIGYGAFEYLYSLKSVVLGDKLETIRGYAFYGASLTDIKLPTSLKFIGGDAFAGCDFEFIELPEQLEYIGGCAFNNCSLKSIRIPASVKEIDGGRFGYLLDGCSNLVEIEVDTHNSRYASENGFLYTIKRDSILNYTYGDPKETIYIPNSVTFVASDLISDADHVKQVYVDNMTPPKYDDDSYGSINKTLYVPKGAYAAYWLADGWCKFKNIVESDLLTANEPIVEANVFDLRQVEKGIAIRVERPMQVAIYAIDGQLLLNKLIETEETIALPQGLYVVKAGDQTAKVRVK